MIKKSNSCTNQPQFLTCASHILIHQGHVLRASAEANEACCKLQVFCRQALREQGERDAATHADGRGKHAVGHLQGHTVAHASQTQRCQAALLHRKCALHAPLHTDVEHMWQQSVWRRLCLPFLPAGLQQQCAPTRQTSDAIVV